jgi:hypothetical protein
VWPLPLLSPSRGPDAEQALEVAIAAVFYGHPDKRVSETQVIAAAADLAADYVVVV